MRKIEKFFAALEQPCEACCGTGYGRNGAGKLTLDLEGKCPRCEGRKTELSEYGQRLIEFVEHYQSRRLA